MPRKTASKGTFRCSTCGQVFGMAMHLGRHMKTKHGQVSAAPKPAGRPRKGPSPKTTSRFNLREMPADELIALLSAAQEEARRRLEGLRQAVG